MAVAYVSSKSATPLTGTTFTSGSWTISGNHPMSHPRVYRDRAERDSLGCVMVARIRDSGSGSQFDAQQRLPNHRCLGDPSTSSGHRDVHGQLDNLNEAREISADLFSGADQTTPCPSGDAVTAGTISFANTAITLAPTNVAAADGVAGLISNTVNGDATGFTTGTSTFNNDTTAINMDCGYHLGASATACRDGTATTLSPACRRRRCSHQSRKRRRLQLDPARDGQRHHRTSPLLSLVEAQTHHLSVGQVSATPRP